MIATTIGQRPAELAEEAARLARRILGEHVEVIWFGSWPQGRAQSHSDIDLAVFAGEAISPEQFAAFSDAVDDMPTLFEVDLLDLGTVAPSLRETILRHGVRL